MTYREFEYWVHSMAKVERCILHKADSRKGYFIAWNNVSLDNINKENWM